MVAEKWLGMNWIRQEKRLAIYLRDGISCVYCTQDLRNALPGDLTLDHLVPRSAGGSNDATNLVTACRSCNSRRGAMVWVTFAQAYEAVARVEERVKQPLNLPLAKAILFNCQPVNQIEEAR